MKWGLGALLAVAVVLGTAAAGAGLTRVEMELSLEGVTLSATTHGVHIELKL